MKVTFWKHQIELFLGWLVIIILSVILIITGTIFTVKEASVYWSILFSGIICLIPSIYVLFFQKKVLSKVTFSNKRIEVIWFKKEITFLYWSDVIEVRATSHGRGHCYLSFISRDQQIDIDPTKKIFKTIMILCPINIQVMIKNIERFKNYLK